MTLLALANIILCVASTTGLMGLTNVALNNVTCVVIPLAMALSLCDTVHIFSHLDRRLLENTPTIKKHWFTCSQGDFTPCFLTTLTTAVGFFSLVVSEIPPIRHFAWTASAAMVFEFIFSFFLFPAIAFCPTDRVFREPVQVTAERSWCLCDALVRFCAQTHRLSSQSLPADTGILLVCHEDRR